MRPQAYPVAGELAITPEGELVIKPQSTREQIVWIDSTLAKVGTKRRT
jgi:hypothetical protein